MIYSFFNCLDTKSGTRGPLSETIYSYIILIPSLQNYKHITCFKLGLLLQNKLFPKL